MSVDYMRFQDFHLPTEDEHAEISILYKQKLLKSWLKRFTVFFIIAVICFVFQTLVRINLPWMFSKEDTIYKLFLTVSTIFIFANILSWFELVLEKQFMYSPDETRICKLKVLTKNTNEMSLKKCFVTCISEKGLIEDPVIVRTRGEYKKIKLGQYIYVERTRDDGHYLYYYLI